MKLSRRKIGTVLGAALVANVAHAQFGALLGGSGDKSSGNLDADVKSFLDLSVNIERKRRRVRMAES